MKHYVYPGGGRSVKCQSALDSKNCASEDAEICG